jgi:cytochrome c biogenesis protein CcdA
MIYGGLAVASVIVLEAYPVYRILSAGYFARAMGPLDYVIVAACFTATLAIVLYLIVKPLRMGLKKVTELEV